MSSSSSSNFGLYVHSAAGSRPATCEEIVAIARYVLDKKLERHASLASPNDVRSCLALRLAELPHEVFGVLFLDAQTRVIEFREMFRGTLTQTSVYPREVVKEALALNAASVILAHNHPSGLPEPSRADEQLTRTLQDALRLVDVRVLDHFVIGGGQSVSFAERGLL